MRMQKSYVLVLTAAVAAAAGLLVAGLMSPGAALGQATDVGLPTDVEVVEAPSADTPVQVSDPGARPPASPPEGQEAAAEPESAEAPAQQLPPAGDGGLEGGLSMPLSMVCLLATGWALGVLGAATVVARRLRLRRR